MIKEQEGRNIKGQFMPGHIMSQKTIQKLSEAHKGEKNHFYGKHHTEEAKEKLRLAKKGKKFPKISEALKGNVPWNKGKKNDIKGIGECIVCGKLFEYKSGYKIYCSSSCKDNRYYRSEKGQKGRYRKHTYYRQKAIEKLGGKCIICGITDWRVLQVNHVNGDGHKERHNPRKIFKEILEGKREGEFDLRCANCNIIYEYETGRLTNWDCLSEEETQLFEKN